MCNSGYIFFISCIIQITLSLVAGAFQLHHGTGLYILKVQNTLFKGRSLALTISSASSISVSNVVEENTGVLTSNNTPGELNIFGVNKLASYILAHDQKEEAEMFNHILNQLSGKPYFEKDLYPGELTINESEVPGGKNIITKSGNIYNINTKTNLISKGPAIIIKKTENEIYYYTGKYIYRNDEKIINNVEYVKKIPNTSYILYSNDSFNCYIVRQDNIQKNNIQKNSLIEGGPLEIISPEELTEEYKTIYETIKQKSNIIPIRRKNNTQELLFINENEEDNKIHTYYIIPDTSYLPFFIKVKQNNNTSSYYILNIDTEKFITSEGRNICIKEEKKLTNNISIVRDHYNNNYILLTGNSLIGGWKDYKDIKQYKKAYEIKGSQTIIIINNNDFYTSNIYLVKKDAPLGSFEILKEAYSTPHEDYYVIQTDDNEFYVFDVKNGKKITDTFQNYNTHNYILNTPKKGILSKEKKIQITETGLQNL